MSYWNCLYYLCNDNNSNDNDPTENDTLDPMRVIKCLWLPLFKYKERKGGKQSGKGVCSTTKIIIECQWIETDERFSVNLEKTFSF